MIYYLLDQARADLEGIAEYIAQRNPAAAVRLIDALHERWELLTLHPFSGKGRDDLRPGARSVIVGEYLTLYRITDSGIEVVRVMHGRRDIGSDDVSG